MTVYVVRIKDLDKLTVAWLNLLLLVRFWTRAGFHYCLKKIIFASSISGSFGCFRESVSPIKHGYRLFSTIFSFVSGRIVEIVLVSQASAR